MDLKESGEGYVVGHKREKCNYIVITKIKLEKKSFQLKMFYCEKNLKRGNIQCCPKARIMWIGKE